MQQNAEMPLNSGTEPEVTNCLNCRSAMPRGLRFCRNCGYRLGEGSAEYTETVRLRNGQPSSTVGSSAPAVGPNDPAPYGFRGAPVAGVSGRVARRRKRHMTGMNWMFLFLIVFFAGAGGITFLVRPLGPGIHIEAPPVVSRSYVGVNQFDTVEGGDGVTFDNVEPPGSPADEAGLVGGDIVKSFDGQAVKSDDEIMELLARTPVGKTVDVIYVRDGEQNTTKLTTISKEEFHRLEKEFRDRSEGRGQFGYDDDEAERVAIPDTKIFGVRLGRVLPNRAADLAGIKEGDVVIGIDKIPIRTAEELRARIQRSLPYSTVRVVVMRGTEKLEIPVKIGKQ